MELLKQFDFKVALSIVEDTGNLYAPAASLARLNEENARNFLYEMASEIMFHERELALTFSSFFVSTIRKYELLINMN